jgi:BON domain
MPRPIASFAAVLVGGLACACAHGAQKVQLDPFAQATRGFPSCPDVPPPLLTAEQARAEAHVRVERGTRCAMDGTCEPGGAYKRDAEVNERMRALIAGNPRFADTSVWVTTTRRWVTLQGCVRTAAQRNALAALVKGQPDVERVFDELAIGARPERATVRAP